MRPLSTLEFLPCSVFFIGNFSQKLNLKNEILTKAKDFFMGKMVQIRQILKRKEFKLPDFYNNFQ
jgi:hypothetical protein